MPAEHHTQLLDIARQLIEGRPTRAALHRAVSSAYYALFHLLVREGTRLIQVPDGLRRQAGRAFDHGTMKDLCGLIQQDKVPKALDTFLPPPHPDDLKRVAAVFVKLQGLRHEADYRPDRAPPFTKATVATYIEEVADAFTRWDAVAGTPTGKAFLLALLLHKRWDR